VTDLERRPVEEAIKPVRAPAGARRRRATKTRVPALAGSGPRWVPRLDVLLILTGLALILLIPQIPDHPTWTPGGLLWHDGWERYRIVEALTRGTRLSDLQNVSPGWSGRWPLLPTLLAAPLWYLGIFALSPAWWLASFNWFVFAGGLLVLWLCLRRTVPPALLRTFLLVLVSASMFPGHLVAYLPFEVFASVLIGFGLLITHCRRRALGWCAAAVGAASVPAAVPALGLVAAVQAVRQRQVRYLAVPVGALALVVADNLVRHGGSLSTYAVSDRGGIPTVLPYSTSSGFSYPWGLGLLGLLFSFGKGLVFFAPGLFLPARRALRAVSPRLWPAQVALLLAVAGLLTVYSSWYGWWGGFFWGPRFLLLASVPASLALAAVLHRPPTSLVLRVGLLAVLVLAVWVGVNGAAFGMAGLPFCDEAASAYSYLCVDTPEYSPLFHPFVARPPLRLPQILFLVFGLLAFARLGGPLIAGILRDVRSQASALSLRRLSVGWHV